MSSIRNDVLAALEMSGDKGATRAEIGEIMGLRGDKELQNVSNHLNELQNKRLILKGNGRWYLAAPLTERTVRQPAVSAQVTSFNGARVDLPAIAKDRTGRSVSVYTLPTEADDIVSIQMCIGGQWMKLPLYGDVRICIDSGVPSWSANQETNRNVGTVRLVKRGGTYADFAVAPGHLVTIAYEES